MDDKDIEISYLRELLIEAHEELLACEWEVNLGTIAKIEAYLESKNLV